MIKKRLLGVVTVKEGRAVQSFGYNRYLPVGRPEILIENLDRWGADEILVQCIDRSIQNIGPDLDLLDRIGRIGLSTPLIYSGGIHSIQDGNAVVQAAADRICIDALLHDDFGVVAGLGARLGAQALIAALPLSQGTSGLQWLDYRTGTSQALSTQLLYALSSGVISEVMVIDWKHEGQAASFDLSLVTSFPLANISIIAFGGLSEPEQLREVLQLPQTVAACVGNFLSYREHAIQYYKKQLPGISLRSATYVRDRAI